jgi:charged multivesicular body protein 5
MPNCLPQRPVPQIKQTNMNRLFGTKSKVPKPTLDDAMGNIDDRVASLDVKITKVNSELATYQQKLAKMRDGPGKSSLKQRAIKLLRQRKQLETQRDQLMSQSWNISQAQMTTENLKNTMITVDVMRQTNKELRKTYGKIDIDKLEDMQDEMLDLIDQSNELQSALGRSYDVPDDISESELDAELEALGDELDLGDAIGSDALPSYLTDNAETDYSKLPSFTEDEPTKSEDNPVPELNS